MGFTPEDQKSHKNIRNKWLQFGRFVRFQPLYESAYEEPIQNASTIFVCEFCLEPTDKIEEFRNHMVLQKNIIHKKNICLQMLCKQRCPPGNEIYRDPHENWNIWEIEGQIETVKLYNL